MFEWCSQWVWGATLAATSSTSVPNSTCEKKPAWTWTTSESKSSDFTLSARVAIRRLRWEQTPSSMITSASMEQAGTTKQGETLLMPRLFFKPSCSSILKMTKWRNLKTKLTTASEKWIFLTLSRKWNKWIRDYKMRQEITNFCWAFCKRTRSQSPSRSSQSKSIQASWNSSEFEKMTRRLLTTLMTMKWSNFWAVTTLKKLQILSRLWALLSIWKWQTKRSRWNSRHLQKWVRNESKKM